MMSVSKMNDESLSNYTANSKQMHRSSADKNITVIQGLRMQMEYDDALLKGGTFTSKKLSTKFKSYVRLKA